MGMGRPWTPDMLADRWGVSGETVRHLIETESEFWTEWDTFAAEACDATAPGGRDDSKNVMGSIFLLHNVS